MAQQIDPEADDASVKTGVEGLDSVLNGGLPARHLYLVEGDPGTGKTTLALRFLMEGRDRGEKVLYIMLAETADEMRAVVHSHGWTLDGIELFAMAAPEDQAIEDEHYTVFHPADIELVEISRRISQEIERIQPSRVVFDSLSELRLLAREPLRYRRQILSLKQFLTGCSCTVLLLDDRAADDGDLQLHSICHGVIRLECLMREYGGARRRLMVTKLRARRYYEGHHDFIIATGGIVVFPRLIASQTRLDLAAPPADMARSGITALDLILGGGIHFGTATLIMGPAGAGKSTLATHYALTLARSGQPAICYVFEETSSNFLIRSAGVGMDLRPSIEKGSLRVEQIDPAEISPGEFADQVRRAVLAGTRFVMIDSINGYLNALPSESFLLAHLHELLVFLNQHGVLTLLVVGQHGLIGSGMKSPIDITYLADAVILLRYFEAFGVVRKALAVLKKRTGGHERTIREYQVTSAGIEIGAPLADFEGVLTGVPVFLGKREELISGGAVSAPPQE